MQQNRNMYQTQNPRRSGKRAYHTRYHGRSDDVYVHFTNNRVEFRYVSPQEYRKHSIGWILLSTFMPVILIVLFLLFLLPKMAGISLSMPTKEMPPTVSTVCAGAAWQTLDDQTDAFSKDEEQVIVKQLRALYMVTGMQTTIETITKESMLASGENTLDAYTNLEYYHLFHENENNILIVFLPASDGKLQYKIEYGKNTTAWMSEEVTQYFENELATNFRATLKYTKGEAVAATFDELNQYIKKHVGEPTKEEINLVKMFRAIDYTMAAIVVFLGILFAVPRLIAGTATRQLMHDGYCRLMHPQITINQHGRKVPEVLRCPYCGGEYPAGMEFCPHCGSETDSTQREKHCFLYTNAV